MRALFIWQLQLPLTVPAAVTVSDSPPLSLSHFICQAWQAVQAQLRLRLTLQFI